MSFRDTQTVTGRLESSAEARREMLARFRARPASDSPAVRAQQDARRAIADARDQRTAERQAQREADAARLAAQAAAEAQAEAERKALAQAEEAERARERLAEQKLQRDARYLARKAKAQKRR